MLIVLGIFAILFGLGLPISFRAYRAYSFYGEYEQVVGALTTARNRAMVNLGQSAHAVCYDAPAHQVQLVRGPCSASGHPEVLELAAPVEIINWPMGGIAFEALSGDSSASGVEIRDAGHSEIITINAYGQID